MQDARARWTVGLAALLVVVASGCGATGSNPESGGPGGVRTSGSDARRVDPEPAAATSPAPAPVPAPAPTTAATLAPAASAAPPVLAPAPTPPIVTIVALGGGAITRDDDHPCSNVSSASEALGQLEVRRSGATDHELVVTYSDSGIAGDFAPLPGQITIPAGAASAVLSVEPTMTMPPAPAHVHRSSSLAITLNDGAAYDIGPESSAAIGLTFDVDFYGCPRSAS